MSDRTLYGKRPRSCPEKHDRCGECNTYPCVLGRPVSSDDTCKTCGSNNRDVRQKMWLAPGKFGYCPDCGHDTPTLDDQQGIANDDLDALVEVLGPPELPTPTPDVEAALERRKKEATACAVWMDGNDDCKGCSDRHRCRDFATITTALHDATCAANHNLLLKLQRQGCELHALRTERDRLRAAAETARKVVAEAAEADDVRCWQESLKLTSLNLQAALEAKR